MKFVEHPCRICGKPALAKWDDDADPEAVDRWLPALAHNRCADLTRERNDAEEHIVRLCFIFVRADDKTRDRLKEKLPQALEAATRRYAKAIAAQMNLETYVWSYDMVRLLMDEPEKCGRILRNYRRQLHELPTAPIAT